MHGGDLGFHKDKEFLDQGKITINFSRNFVYFGVSVWVNETFQLTDKITDTYFHIMQLFVSVLYKEHVETWRGTGKDVFPKTYSYSVLYVCFTVGSATRYNFIPCLAQKLPIWNI